VREEKQQISHRAFISLIGETPSFNHRAQGSGENEWYTPIEYIEKARKVLGRIDLDPATSNDAQARSDRCGGAKGRGASWLRPGKSCPSASGTFR
jgi:hypothetical protein